jgi:serine/threonine-protein kinase ATR
VITLALTLAITLALTLVITLALTLAITLALTLVITLALTLVHTFNMNSVDIDLLLVEIFCSLICQVIKVLAFAYMCTLVLIWIKITSRIQ